MPVEAIQQHELDIITRKRTKWGSSSNDYIHQQGISSSFVEDPLDEKEEFHSCTSSPSKAVSCSREQAVKDKVSLTTEEKPDQEYPSNAVIYKALLLFTIPMIARRLGTMIVTRFFRSRIIKFVFGH